MGPLKREDKTLQERFERFFSVAVSLQVDEVIFRETAVKRARHSIKTPDALHLTTAERSGCTAFWTNDNRLKGVSSLVVNVLEDTS